MRSTRLRTRRAVRALGVPDRLLARPPAPAVELQKIPRVQSRGSADREAATDAERAVTCPLRVTDRVDAGREFLVGHSAPYLLGEPVRPPAKCSRGVGTATRRPAAPANCVPAAPSRTRPPPHCQAVTCMSRSGVWERSRRCVWPHRALWPAKDRGGWPRNRSYIAGRSTRDLPRRASPQGTRRGSGARARR
jgi:hypothetical protein